MLEDLLINLKDCQSQLYQMLLQGCCIDSLDYKTVKSNHNIILNSLESELRYLSN